MGNIRRLTVTTASERFVQILIEEELNALDRRTAELRGWRWDAGTEDDPDISLYDCGEGRSPWVFGAGVLFSPTSNALQGTVLLEEMPHPYLEKSEDGSWFCKPDVFEWRIHGEGATPWEAVVRAYIAWKEATLETSAANNPARRVYRSAP